VGIRCADHVTPLYPQKLALTSPTGGSRSVGIVRSQTKATERELSPTCFTPHGFVIRETVLYAVQFVLRASVWAVW